jgi:hypothetical protein
VRRDTGMIDRIDGRIAAIIAALVVQVAFFAPLRIYLKNIVDFPIGVGEVVLGLTVLSAILLAILYAAALRLPELVVPAVIWLALVAFLESTVFIGLAAHRPFDGQPIDWSQWARLSRVELAAIAAMLVAVVVWRRRLEIWRGIALSILLFGAMNVALAAVTQSHSLQLGTAGQTGSYYEGFARLSTERNVIHIVPDSSQGAMVWDILRSDPDRYGNIFDGFTLFTHAMGRYPSTYPSIPFFMTGVSPEPQGDFSFVQPFTWQQIQDTLKDRSIVRTLGQHGFRTFGYQVGNLYCVGFSACAGGMVFDGLPLELGGRTAAFLQLLDVTLFQTSPIVLRQIVYNNGQWRLRALRGHGERTYSAVLDEFVDRATADAPASTYSYIHLAGGHGPLQFDEQCAYVGIQPPTFDSQRRQVVCTLRQLERLIDTHTRRQVIHRH